MERVNRQKPKLAGKVKRNWTNNEKGRQGKEKLEIEEQCF
jgi:hypothetical protein